MIHRPAVIRCEPVLIECLAILCQVRVRSCAWGFVPGGFRLAVVLLSRHLDGVAIALLAELLYLGSTATPPFTDWKRIMAIRTFTIPSGRVLTLAGREYANEFRLLARDLEVLERLGEQGRISAWTIELLSVRLDNIQDIIANFESVARWEAQAEEIEVEVSK